MFEGTAVVTGKDLVELEDGLKLEEEVMEADVFLAWLVESVSLSPSLTFLDSVGALEALVETSLVIVDGVVGPSRL